MAVLLHEGEAKPAKSPARPSPVPKELRVSLNGKEAALRRLAQRVAQWQHSTIEHRVTLTDGADALQQQLRAHLPGFPLVLDIIHAVEYRWQAANALLGERHPDRAAWMREHLQLSLAGNTVALIITLEHAAADPALSSMAQQAVLRTAGYYQRNLPSMRYDAYLAQGWPIGTGIVEGARGHVVSVETRSGHPRSIRRTSVAVRRAARPTGRRSTKRSRLTVTSGVDSRRTPARRAVRSPSRTRWTLRRAR